MREPVDALLNAIRRSAETRAQTFDVVVGNIGTVAEKVSEKEAERIFAHYVEQSETGCGKASGEDVTMTDSNGEPVKEHIGEMQ